MSRRYDIDAAVRDLLKEYDKAKDAEYIRNPVAYALYQVWKKWDKERS